VEQVDELRRVIRTDPAPRVRQRAQMVLLLAQGETVPAVARLFRAARHRVRRWRGAWAARGRDGLADAPRTGRPPKLTAGDLVLLADALGRGPQAYGWPVAVWSVGDLQALLQQARGTEVGLPALYRAVRGLGYRYRRPRLDLRHRQDAEAVASARGVPGWLGKGRAPGSCTSSAPTSAGSTGTHGWRASGSGAGAP
jgi:transposase